MRRLRRLREKKGITQAELARIIGTARSSISSYENGSRYPDTTNMQKICEYFGVSKEFIDGKPDLDKVNNLKNACIELLKCIEELGVIE